MGKVLVTAQVENLEEWEAGFRTHGDLFKGQGIGSPIQLGTTGDNEVAVCFDAADVEAYLQELQGPDTAEAMAKDGVRTDTVKVFVLDKEYAF